MQKHPDIKSRFGRRGEHLVALQAILMAAFVLAPPWPPMAGGAVWSHVARWLLCALCWAGALYFGIGGVRAIRKYLTPLPYPADGNRLVNSGPYRLVRHPLYTAIMLAFAGWTIFTASAVHGALTAVAYLFFSYKASREEAWLRQRHNEYDDYASHTGRFLPQPGGKHRPG